MANYLDKTGLAYFWKKVKAYVDSKVSGGSSISDTGWVQITSFSNDCTHYSSATTVYARQYGKVVTIIGVVKNNSALSTKGGGAVTMFTLPSSIGRPKEDIVEVQQGSGINRFAVKVDSSGNVGAMRYGTTSLIDIPSGHWLNVHCTYMVA